MAQPLFKGALNDACVELAKQVVWVNGETSSDIVETFALKLQEVALSHVEYVIESDRDPNLITRAIHYLAETHAIPPMSTDLVWFREMLLCLIELAVPNSGLSPKGAQFILDLQVGIEESLNSTGT